MYNELWMCLKSWILIENKIKSEKEIILSETKIDSKQSAEQQKKKLILIIPRITTLSIS